MRHLTLTIALCLPLVAESPMTPQSLLQRHQAISGTSPDLFAERARLRFMIGDAKGAEEDLSNAFTLGPARGETFRLAALVRLSAGQVDKAFALHEQMLKVAPKADDAFSHAAVDLIQAGFLEKADAMMELACKLDPRDWEEILHFALAAARAKDTALAVKWFSRIKGMDKSDAKQEARPMFEFLLGAGMAEEAAALAEPMLLAQPREWELALGVARAAMLSGNKTLMDKWSERALQLGGGQPTLLVELALLKQGKAAPYRR